MPPRKLGMLNTLVGSPSGNLRTSAGVIAFAKGGIEAPRPRQRATRSNDAKSKGRRLSGPDVCFRGACSGRKLFGGLGLVIRRSVEAGGSSGASPPGVIPGVIAGVI